MKKERINGNDLIALGYTENHAIGVALKINKKRHGYTREQMLAKFRDVLNHPENYLTDKVFKPLSKALLAIDQVEASAINLREQSLPYTVYGEEHIDKGAKQQMHTALKLPISIAGALMPDAHQGYGLPIGGVLATNNAVIPYGVGVDIGCRMALSIFDLPAHYLDQEHQQLKKAILDNTRFGAGKGYEKQERAEHAVLDNPLFKTDKLIHSLKDKAWAQLGTSGGGNHFVEFGILSFDQDDTMLGVAQGSYLALLTHSGSRGLGATLADHYTRLAKSLCKLPREAQNLVYLDLNSEEGQSYWLAMNLAGDYALACHEIIHQKIKSALGAELLAKVENHHNFAWKELLNGQEVIVHRKGATPASKDILGIIPGSMATPGFLVRGKGTTAAINSAAHGAGRLMSRTQALKTLSTADLNNMLADQGITLLGAGMDEAPMAYKNIHQVMAAQSDLVDIVATFSPKIVRMADDGSRED
ncbi:RtcB family protein [Sphingobacterium sp. UT-1RO-CII-1]|uniref:RtcB family protein n=1 Tax=Sphingobacterium sp. UT-1RO-CII-1 TaxID=2995225 RepID=UPI00227C908C|nr:RtcB family protein [Sphingobacterium sp. UT-1RO-CII-1]MCY4778831.1 RtcB family protein [Sphingobacterium sp. UT-1RO-CII-1]